MQKRLKSLKSQNVSVVQKFEQIVEKYPNKTCVIFEDQFWSFQRLNALSNRVSNVVQEFGFKKQQTIALYMNNRPEFIAIWLGLAKAGLTTALINTNVKNDGLVHMLRQCQCKAVIFEDKLKENIDSIVTDMEMNANNDLDFYFNFDSTNTCVESTRFVSLKPLIDRSSDDKKCVIESGFTDTLFYMFTSGTTGLPKASVVPNSKYLLGSVTGSLMTGLRVSDIIYICLPLYHGAGGMLSLTNSLCNGLTVVLAEKFSVNHFWVDCIRYECTAFVYIGEMCRYLLRAMPKDSDNKHKIGLMFGFGLRDNIWKQFIQRFGIENVCEFYASTEGNVMTVNRDNRLGACGFIPYYWGPVLKSLYPTRIIKIDEQTNEVIRDKNGLCIECNPGQIGEIVAKIVDSDETKAFYGYTDNNETQKKIIENVFTFGDKAFRTFDKMQINCFGDLYFTDRTGDTFRWKGENVSTTEVESVLSKITNNLFDCIVFGVEIPDCDGKAGMAVIASDPCALDLTDLLTQLHNHLPTYAIPVFIRFANKIDITCSLRLIKTDFERKGYNLNDNNDWIYFWDKNIDKYIKVDENIFNQICQSIIKL